MSNHFTAKEIDDAEPVLFVELDEKHQDRGFATREHEITADELLALQEQIKAYQQLTDENPSQQSLLAATILLRKTIQQLIQKAQWEGMKNIAVLLEKFGMFAVTHETQEFRHQATKQKQYLEQLIHALPPTFRT